MKNDDILGQQRTGPVKIADEGYQVPEAVRTAEVHGDKEQAHDHGRHREELTEYDHFVHLPVFEDISRNHHHHCRGRHERRNENRGKKTVA